MLYTCVQYLISSVAALQMKTVELNLPVILRSTSTSLDIYLDIDG